MWVSRYFVWFVVYSCMGWIFETIYCTIQNKKWKNRGFLYGPICPIYGAGALAISAIAEFAQSRGIAALAWWQIFLISFLGSVVLEYGTSWVLEKLFHAYWWDYSNMPLNVNGRICLPASVGFGLGGLIVIYGIYPFMVRWTAHISPLLMELFSLIVMGIVAADLALTVSALTNFAKEVQMLEDNLNQHMEALVESIGAKRLGIEQRLLEERERFSRENLNYLASNMNRMHRSTLDRVKGFRPQYQGASREEIEEQLEERLEKVRKALKKYMKK